MNYQELLEAVKSPTNIIGLMGHQPSLKKVRQAYDNNEINEQELAEVLQELAETIKDQESFKSKEDLFRHMFPNPTKSITKTIPNLTQEEQLAYIKSTMPEKKKYSGPRKKAAPKKVVTIDVSLLPPELRGLL